MKLQHKSNCFVCGKDNLRGLQTGFELDGKNRVKAEFFPQPWQGGGAGALHGGLVCALLDEAMASVINAALGVHAPTVSLEIRMSKPIKLTEEKIIVTAELIDKNEKRRLYSARATIELPDGTVLASGQGKFLESRKEQVPPQAVSP